MECQREPQIQKGMGNTRKDFYLFLQPSKSHGCNKREDITSSRDARHFMAGFVTSDRGHHLDLFMLWLLQIRKRFILQREI